MTRRQALLYAGCLVAATPAALHAENADPAKELALAVHRRPSGSDLTAVTEMKLVEPGKATRARELITYRMRRDSGETARLLRFLEPLDVAGTGLLSIDKPDGSVEQWLFLPALDRVRRIAGDRKGGRFVGSELYYEDLQERHPSRDKQRLAGREAIDGVMCDVLESIPEDREDSVYRKRVSWIDRQTLLPMRVDYFEHDESTPSKRWLLTSKKRHGTYWTVTGSRMIDLASGRETQLMIKDALYDRKLPARLFTSQTLADERLESTFRP